MEKLFEDVLMDSASRVWQKTKIETDLFEKDKSYHEVTLLREMSNYVRRYGESDFKEFMIENVYEA